MSFKLTVATILRMAAEAMSSPLGWPTSVMPRYLTLNTIPSSRVSLVSVQFSGNSTTEVNQWTWPGSLKKMDLIDSMFFYALSARDIKPIIQWYAGGGSAISTKQPLRPLPNIHTFIWGNVASVPCPRTQRQSGIEWDWKRSTTCAAFRSTEKQSSNSGNVSNVVKNWKTKTKHAFKESNRPPAWLAWTDCLQNKLKNNNKAQTARHLNGADAATDVLLALITCDTTITGNF